MSGLEGVMLCGVCGVRRWSLDPTKCTTAVECLMGVALITSPPATRMGIVDQCGSWRVVCVGLTQQVRSDSLDTYLHLNEI